MKFRDTANWYHIVTHFDVANSTTTDRLKFYVNGVEQTKTVTYGSYPANQNYAFSNTVDQTIGGATHFVGYEFDGYLCDYHFIDGSLVSHNSFGEFKNGIWIPKIVNTSAITYGTNGFRLEFGLINSALEILVKRKKNTIILNNIFIYRSIIASPSK